MNRWKMLFLLAAVIACTMVALGAFAQNPNEQQGPVTTLSTSTEVVMVPVVVRDGQGKHVPGLKKDDFFVAEAGKPQKIAFFEEITPTSELRLAKVPAGEHANTIVADPTAQQLTVVVLDMINTEFADQAYARSQLLKYLSQSMNATQPTALLALERRGLFMLHDFTSDRSQLIAALQQVSGKVPTNIRATSLQDTGVSRTTVEHALDTPQTAQTGQGVKIGLDTAERLLIFHNSAEANLAAIQDRQALSATLAAFQQIANAYSGVPGRKSLVWATAGFPFSVDGKGNLDAPSLFSTGDAATQTIGTRPAYDSTGGLPALPETTSVIRGGDLAALTPMFERTMQLLNNANISVYPIDVRGLIVTATGAERSTSNENIRSQLDSRRINSQVSMNSVASLTGGRAFYNRNDIDTAFRNAAEDNSSYYYVGYYRDKNDKPGYRRLEVKVSRPSVQVRSRQGYYVAKKLDSKEMRQFDVLSALASPIEFSGIPIMVRWKGTPTEGKGGKKTVTFDLYMPPDKMAPPDDKMNLDIVAMAVTGPKNERADQFVQSIGADLKPETVAQIRKEGLNYSNQLNLPPGEFTVKFVVRDNRNGRIGSVIAPLKVQ